MLITAAQLFSASLVAPRLVLRETMMAEKVAKGHILMQLYRCINPYDKTNKKLITFSFRAHI